MRFIISINRIMSFLQQIRVKRRDPRLYQMLEAYSLLRNADGKKHKK